MYKTIKIVTSLAEVKSLVQELVSANPMLPNRRNYTVVETTFDIYDFKDLTNNVEFFSDQQLKGMFEFLRKPSIQAMVISVTYKGWVHNTPENIDGQPFIYDKDGWIS